MHSLPPGAASEGAPSLIVTGETSDGYHTFNELYEHRMVLTAALMRSHPDLSWKSRHHHVGGDPMFEGYFIAGMDLPTGTITYHYQLKHWQLFPGVRVLPHAPEWDGATPADTIERLKSWIIQHP